MHAPSALAFVENLAALKRASRLAAATAYESLGLNDTQMKMLRFVAANPPVTQAELARATETDASLLGRSMTSLLQRGELKRTPSPDDRRAYVVALGPYGKRLLARVNEASERLVRQLSAPLDARDLADFERITNKLVSAVEQRSRWEEAPKTKYVSRRVRAASSAR